MTRKPDRPRRIVLLPNRELTEAIDVAAARARTSAPALLLRVVAEAREIAQEMRPAPASAVKTEDAA